MKVALIGIKILVCVGLLFPSLVMYFTHRVVAASCNYTEDGPEANYPPDSCNSYRCDSVSGWCSWGYQSYSCGYYPGIAPGPGWGCYWQYYSCLSSCSGSGGGATGPVCADQSAPACQQGSCTGGKVCVSVGSQGACGCSNGASCTDYVGDPQNLRATRLTSTSARIRWTAPSAYQYVSTQRLAIARNRQDALNCSYNNLADPSGLCVVDVRDLPKTVGSYDTASVLTPGYQYYVVLTIVAGDAPGGFSQCKTTASIQHLSSCELTPDPTTVAVGADATMTTNLAQNLWSVAYSRSPASKATVTTPDTSRLYQTTVHGVADGQTIVTNSVTYSAGGAEMCSDTATVNVGCTNSAPTAPPLVSPSDGASLTNLTVPLDWNAPTWGTGCPTNSNRYLVYADTSPSPTTLRATISTPVNNPTSNYNFTAPGYGTYYWKVVADNGPRATSSLIRSFTIAPAFSGVAWWQVSGAGIYAGLSVRSEVPVGNYLIIPGSLGSVGALMREAGTIDTGSGGLSTSALSALTKYQGKRMNYAYFEAQLGFVKGKASDWSASNEITLTGYPTGQDYGYMKPVSGSATISSPMTVGASDKYVIMVDGDLTISENITVTNGGYLMFIVKGNINIAPNVATLQGVYVMDGVFTTESVATGNDVRLIVTGNVVTWSSVDLQRDLGSSGNSVPAEQFVYSREMILAMPDNIKAFAMEWQEVVSGSF